MGELIHNIHVNVKKTSGSFFVFCIKLVSGMLLGLTMTLILETVFNYGAYLFWFIMVLSCGMLLRVAKGWGLGGILVFDFVCVLVALLLRMYVLVAPM